MNNMTPEQRKLFDLAQKLFKATAKMRATQNEHGKAPGGQRKLLLAEERHKWEKKVDNLLKQMAKLGDTYGQMTLF